MRADFESIPVVTNERTPMVLTLNLYCINVFYWASMHGHFSHCKDNGVLAGVNCQQFNSAPVSGPVIIR